MAVARSGLGGHRRARPRRRWPAHDPKNFRPSRDAATEWRSQRYEISRNQTSRCFPPGRVHGARRGPPPDCWCCRSRKAPPADGPGGVAGSAGRRKCAVIVQRQTGRSARRIVERRLDEARKSARTQRSPCLRRLRCAASQQDRNQRAPIATWRISSWKIRVRIRADRTSPLRLEALDGGRRDVEPARLERHRHDGKARDRSSRVRRRLPTGHHARAARHNAIPARAAGGRAARSASPRPRRRRASRRRNRAACPSPNRPAQSKARSIATYSMCAKAWSIAIRARSEPPRLRRGRSRGATSTGVARAAAASRASRRRSDARAARSAPRAPPRGRPSPSRADRR